jgi:hypothetical protein
VTCLSSSVQYVLMLGSKNTFLRLAIVPAIRLSTWFMELVLYVSLMPVAGWGHWCFVGQFG